MGGCFRLGGPDPRVCGAHTGDNTSCGFRTHVGLLSGFKQVQNLAVPHADFVEAITESNPARGEVVGIGRQFDASEPELSECEAADLPDGLRSGTATAEIRMRPVRQIRGCFSSGLEFAPSYELARSSLADSERKTHAGAAFVCPTCNDGSGMLQRRHEVLGEVKAVPVLGVTVDLAQHRSVRRHKGAELHLAGGAV